ncbi:recombinase family protein [Cryptosporangium sp. NPDC048952]|uniref:recombinase family protein n=1 Tax=Cryptosporangium sp. NPDC048952 TaxID=3363961 RepID=UPI0037203FDB
MTGSPVRGAISALGLALVRVSTGSQDLLSQKQVIEAAAIERGIQIVDWIELQGYSASGGAQEPALRQAIDRIGRGDASMLIVTESSRLDRRENLDAQAEILLAIRAAGGDVLSLSEPLYGKTDFPGRIVTLVLQQANAEKSRTVKDTTYRGMAVIRDNKAHHGPLPAFWTTEGVRYAKQAVCADPAAVRDIYERVADGESLSAVARSYGMYPAGVKSVIRFAANHTGFVECRYTYNGVTETWMHAVSAVVESPLWWRANKVLEANRTAARANKGGRPVASPANWVSGVLDCPGCGGFLYVNVGRTPAGNLRTPKLRCGGKAKKRLACGLFTGIDAAPIVELIEGRFAGDETPVLAFQRVAGNAHELDALNAELRRVQGSLSATEDDKELDALIANRKAMKAQVEGFALVPDRFDYAPTGQSVAGMWTGGDDAVKRSMVRAVKNSYGMALALHEGQWGLTIGVGGSNGLGGTDDPGDTVAPPRADGRPGAAEIAAADRIVDLGDGLCFRPRPRTGPNSNSGQ